jgi:hypothetical protein
MANVLIDETIRIQVTFLEWQEEELILPETSVHVEILDEDTDNAQLLDGPFSVIEVSPGTYYFDWIPDELGTFYVRFVAGPFDRPEPEFTSITEEITVVESIEELITLGEAQELVFATDSDPLYVDPEEIKAHYPEASLVEILLYVSRFSREVHRIFNGAEPSFIALEYIRAAVLCAISKIYDYGGGDANSFALGDLKISNQVYPRNRITVANAGNWCELAAALRDEMLRGESNIKAVRKGTKFTNPMPKRKLRNRYGGNGRRLGG